MTQALEDKNIMRGFRRENHQDVVHVEVIILIAGLVATGLMINDIDYLWLFTVDGKPSDVKRIWL